MKDSKVSNGKRKESIIVYFTGADLEIYDAILEAAKGERRSTSNMMVIAAERYVDNAKSNNATQ